MKVQNNHTYFVGNDPNRIEQNNGENKKTGANASYMMKQTDPMALKREQAKKKAMSKSRIDKIFMISGGIAYE